VRPNRTITARAHSIGAAALFSLAVPRKPGIAELRLTRRQKPPPITHSDWEISPAGPFHHRNDTAADETAVSAIAQLRETLIIRDDFEVHQGIQRHSLSHERQFGR
jgi:hypothetical protein